MVDKNLLDQIKKTAADIKAGTITREQAKTNLGEKTRGELQQLQGGLKENKITNEQGIDALQQVKPIKTVEEKQIKPIEQQQPTNTQQAPTNTPKITPEQPKFGYETTFAQREKRNQDIAQSFLDKKTEVNKKELEQQIRAVAGDVSDADIQNTLNDIQKKYNKLKLTRDIELYDSNQLSNQIIAGNLTTDDIQGLKLSDPVKYQEIVENVKKQKEILTNNDTLKTTNDLFSNDKVKTSLDNFVDISTNYQEAVAESNKKSDIANQNYKDALNNEKLLADREELNQTEAEIADLDNEINYLKESITEEYGTGISKSLLNSLIADRGYNLLKQKNTLLLKAQTLGTSINNAINQAKTNYEVDIAQVEQDRADALQAYGVNKDVFNMQWKALERQLDSEEKAFWNKQDIQNQLSMMKVDDMYKKNYATFTMELNKQYGDSADFKYITDSEGNTSIFDGANKVATYSSNPDDGALMISSGTSGNRPDRNNNPGNIKIGDVGYGVDDQNHTIFATAEDGYNALIAEIQTKLTGGSKHYSKLTGEKLGPNSTLADLGSVYAEDKTRASKVASMSGYDTTTKLRNIDANKLAPAIMKQEGFTGIVKTTPGKSDEALKKVAQDVVYGRVPITQIDNLGYSKDEIKKIETYRQEILQDIPSTYILDLDDRNAWIDKKNKEFFTKDYVNMYKESSSKLGQLKNIIGVDGGPADVGLIFGFMKSLDPTSVVRESEYKSAVNSLGLGAELEGGYQKIFGEGMIPEEYEQSFLDVLLEVDRSRKQDILGEIKDIEAAGMARGLDKNELFLLHGFDQEEINDLKTDYYGDGSWVREYDDNTYDYKDKNGNYFVRVPQNTPITKENANIYISNTPRFNDEDILSELQGNQIDYSDF